MNSLNNFMKNRSINNPTSNIDKENGVCLKKYLDNIKRYGFSFDELEKYQKCIDKNTYNSEHKSDKQ